MNNWIFYTEDGDFAFVIKSKYMHTAYNDAYDSHGPQVEDMRYQLFEHAPDYIKAKCNHPRRYREYIGRNTLRCSVCKKEFS